MSHSFVRHMYDGFENRQVSKTETFLANTSSTSRKTSQACAGKKHFPREVRGALRYAGGSGVIMCRCQTTWRVIFDTCQISKGASLCLFFAWKTSSLGWCICFRHAVRHQPKLHIKSPQWSSTYQGEVRAYSFEGRLCGRLWVTGRGADARTWLSMQSRHA